MTRKFSLIWRHCTLWAHLLDSWWEGHLSNGPASARVPGLASTSTWGHDPDPECISVSRSVLSSPPGIWGPERHQHGPPLWRRRTHAAATADRLSAGTPKGTLPPQDSPACRRQKTTQPRRQGLMTGAGQAEGPLVCV